MIKKKKKIRFLIGLRFVCIQNNLNVVGIKVKKLKMNNYKWIMETYKFNFKITKENII